MSSYHYVFGLFIFLQGQILTVRYEDLAHDLLSITSLIYKFVGLEMLPSVKDFLNQMTSRDAQNMHGKIAGDLG